VPLERGLDDPTFVGRRDRTNPHGGDEECHQSRAGLNADMAVASGRRLGRGPVCFASLPSTRRFDS
jgi:hypothetical protein